MNENTGEMKDKPHLFSDMTTGQLQCPSCGEEIDAGGAFGKQAERKLRSEFNQRYLKLKKALEEREGLVEKERLEVKRLSAQTWEIIQEELKKEKIRLAEKLAHEAKTQTEWEINKLKELVEKQKQENILLKQKEISILRKEQDLEAARQLWELEQEKEKILMQKELEQNLRSQYVSQQDLLKIEYERKLADQKKLIDEMSRKMNQGSMKLQGDAQEQAVEEFLRYQFPEDQIDPVKAGNRGADCLHLVNSSGGKVCGKIYYESKRTKSFQNSWIEKFKVDMRVLKADIGVLVTQVMPKGMDRMGELDGIWICTYDDLKSLAPVLRASLIQIGEVMLNQEQSTDKMSILYTYLTSNEFRMQIEGIVEGFSQLQIELNKEKRAMHAIWKRREKQIEKVLLNTNHMYSSIKGIAGSEVQDIDALSLPPGETV